MASNNAAVYALDASAVTVVGTVHNPATPPVAAAQTPQAIEAINEIYLEVLGRPVDAAGLAYAAILPAGGGSLDQIRYKSNPVYKLILSLSVCPETNDTTIRRWVGPGTVRPHWPICVHPFLIRGKILAADQSRAFEPAKEFTADKKGISRDLRRCFRTMLRSGVIPMGSELPSLFHKRISDGL